MRKDIAAALVSLASISIIFASPASAQRWGFEDGSLQGWIATGTAFASQPTLGNNLPPRRPGETPANEGNYWVGTYEARHDLGTVLGTTQGDGPQGTLLSPPFQIEGPSVSFLIGGGNDFANEFVALMVRRDSSMPPYGRPEEVLHLDDGEYFPMLRATGRNEEQMRRVDWDVSRYAGKTARFRIVDQASGPWGHVNADSFHLGWEQRLGRAVPVPPTGNVVVQGVPTVPGGPVVVQPALPPLPAGVQSGRFRLTLTGFKVVHQTGDNALESDGVGDEVFFRGDSFAYAAGTQLAGEGHVHTSTFGQNFQPLNIGSAPAAWNDPSGIGGGLRTDDVYPRRDPFSTAPSRRGGDLPLILWEGSLVRDYDAIVVVPSAWEWDSPDRSAGERVWDDQLRDRVSAATDQIGAFAHRWPTDRPSPIVDELTDGLVIWDDGTRPIGAMDHQRAFPLPGAPLPHVSAMRPRAIVLTYDSAMMALGRRYSETITQQQGGTGLTSEQVLAPGVIPFELFDRPALQGDYLLYLKLERLP
jgi:hypothetical protein